MLSHICAILHSLIWINNSSVTDKGIIKRVIIAGVLMQYLTVLMMTEIKIPLSKTKILLLLLGSTAFVIAGISFIIAPETFISSICRSTQFIRLAGIASVLFFGAAAIYGARKFFDKSIGLTIDDNGINDNTNASSAGLINWTDIREIKTHQVMSTKFLLIFIDNPEKYLERASRFKRQLMRANMKMYGTPLSITSNTLKYSYNELEKIILESFKEQHEKMLST